MFDEQDVFVLGQTLFQYLAQEVLSFHHSRLLVLAFYSAEMLPSGVDQYYF